MMEIPYDYPTCQFCYGRGQVKRVDGRSIRRIREAAKITMTSMANRLGISPTYLGEMERGGKRMSEELAWEVLEICGRVGQ